MTLTMKNKLMELKGEELLNFIIENESVINELIIGTLSINDDVNKGMFSYVIDRDAGSEIQEALEIYNYDQASYIADDILELLN